MFSRDLWIALNLVNVLALARVIALLARQLRVAERDYALPSAVASANARARQTLIDLVWQLATNAFLALLGLFLIVVALALTDDIPWYVPAGTGFFLLIWLNWLLRNVWRASSDAHIAALEAADRDRLAIDRAD